VVNVRNVVTSRISGTPSKQQNPDEVKKFADHLKIVSDLSETARKMSGADKIEEEKRNVEQQLQEAQQQLSKMQIDFLSKQLDEIKSQLKTATENKDLPMVRELERKLEEVRDAYHKAELEALRKEIEKLRGEKSDIAEEIKKIKEVGKELGLSSGSPPPDILIELKKMDYQLQLEIERLRDERDRREKEWQLQLRKWEEEKELRKQEVEARIAADREKLEALKTIGTRLGKAIFESAMESSQPAIAGRSKSYTVEAIEGESGEFTCPDCGSTVGLLPDTEVAVCAGCRSQFPVKRTPKPEKVSSGETEKNIPQNADLASGNS
jgi:DNA repair exonuclease SbcCD ATPase subunit